MRVVAMLSFVFCAGVLSSTASAQRSEMSEHITVSGKVIDKPDCSETGLAIKEANDNEICLGSNELGLAVDAHYELGGELTEDGFFPNEFLN